MSSLSRLFGRLKRSSPLGSETKTVAIGCQGGGSHAAFTAGVLGKLLVDLPENYEVVGLSGASGGAVSATAAWYGMAADGRTSSEVLADVWNDVAATSGWELWVNELTLLKAGSTSGGSSVSPYSSPGSDWGRDQLESILTSHIDFGAFEGLSKQSDAPALLVSAADVTAGEFAIFRNESVTPAAVLASAAVPHLFEAVDVDGSRYWDGFLSQNPPLLEFVTDDAIDTVDELWIVQLTPETTENIPTSASAIEDRTQQLIENLSLGHERRFLETMNDWIATGKLSEFTETEIRTIELHDEQTEKSRLNRRSSFIGDLYDDGVAEATNFLKEIE